LKRKKLLFYLKIAYGPINVPPKKPNKNPETL